MAIEEGDENRLNGITSVIESDDTIEASSNPTAPLLDAGKQSDNVAQPGLQLISLLNQIHPQLVSLHDRMKKLEQMASIQLQVVGFFEEPGRTVMKKLANGLYEVGELIVAIFTDIRDLSSGQSKEIGIKIAGQLFCHEILTIENLYKDSFSKNYEGQLSVLSKKMGDRSKDYEDPEKFPFINWIKYAKSSSGDTDLRNQPTSTNILNDLIGKGDDFKLYGEEMKQSFDSQYILKLSSPNFYNKLFIILQCISLAFYTVDVGSDVWLAYNYSQRGEMLFFGLTVCCVVIPSIITSYTAYLWDTNRNLILANNSVQGRTIIGFRGEPIVLDENGWSKRAHFVVDVVMPMYYRYIELIRCGFINQKNTDRIQSTIKAISEKIKDNDVIDEENHGYVLDQCNKLVKLSDMKVALHIMMKECEMSFLRFLEGFLEAAPQLILQLTILKMSSFNLLKTDQESYVTADVIRYVSILTSLMGLAWIPVNLYRTMRFSIFFQNKSLKRYKEMKEEITTCFGYFDAGFLYGDLVLFLAQFFGIVSRMIVLSQFVSVNVLPLFLIFHCGWQFKNHGGIPRQFGGIFILKMVVIYAWIGFVNIFTFIGLTLYDRERQTELIFPLSKNMFINYKYFAVCFAENTFFLVIYVLNAHGYFGNYYDPIGSNDGWSCSYHTFFVVAQPLLFLISFNLLHLHSLFYSKKYQDWFKKESENHESFFSMINIYK